MRSIGMDVARSLRSRSSRTGCAATRADRVRPEDLRAWAATLEPDDEIALEATTNLDAIATPLRPLVAKVVVSNPRKTRAIAEAKVKTDKVDARILAQLLAADFLPGTWVADDRTRTLRRLVMRRTHLVKQRTREEPGPRDLGPESGTDVPARRHVLRCRPPLVAHPGAPPGRRVAQHRVAAAPARLPWRRASPRWSVISRSRRSTIVPPPV